MTLRAARSREFCPLAVLWQSNASAPASFSSGSGMVMRTGQSERLTVLFRLRVRAWLCAG
jgi:hypothetical protein